MNMQNSRRDERGAGLVEYALIVFLVSVFAIGVVMTNGDNLRALFSTADNSLAGVDSTPATRLPTLIGTTNSDFASGRLASGMNRGSSSVLLAT